MFKFNFSCNSDDENTSENTDVNNDVEWFESNEINPSNISVISEPNYNSISCDNCNIKHLSAEGVLNCLKNAPNNCFAVTAEQNHSDLITAKYEGGLKIWECTYDLLKFLESNQIDFNDKNVLDLGCGAGIVGIFAGLKGAYTVFQDYNSEVLSAITIPNVSLNNISFDRCAFFSGDWSSFAQKTKQNIKFDYIFTSETIYNPANYAKLINVFLELVKPSGTIYLAAKHYYFGVGGGISQFTDMLAQSNLNFATLWECKDGVKRSIIKIKLN